jgi:DNA (cytosine-5)-methyltransferase 1
MRIIEETSPSAVFLENVKNLKSHDNGNTYRVIRESLESEGYEVKEAVLNTMRYGNIPQNRERIYVVAFKRKADGSSAMDHFSFPEEVELT